MTGPWQLQAQAKPEQTLANRVIEVIRFATTIQGCPGKATHLFLDRTTFNKLRVESPRGFWDAQEGTFYGVPIYTVERRGWEHGTNEVIECVAVPE